MSNDQETKKEEVVIDVFNSDAPVCSVDAKDAPEGCESCEG